MPTKLSAWKACGMINKENDAVIGPILKHPIADSAGVVYTPDRRAITRLFNRLRFCGRGAFYGLEGALWR